LQDIDDKKMLIEKKLSMIDTEFD